MIAGAVLAAGRGERMGQPKAWLRTAREGECFLSRACALLADTGVDPVVAVVAPGAELMAGRVAPGAVVVANAEPERGQLSSLQTAIGAIAAPWEALIMLPVDVPLVSDVTVRALIEAWRRSRAPVVRPVSGTRHGHPVIFARALFETLMKADVAIGAKPVVRTYATPAGDIPVDDEGAFADVDTVEDYLRAFGWLPERLDLR